MVGGQVQSQDKRFRKALSPPYSSLLRMTQAKSRQELEEKAGVGWNELEEGGVGHKMSTIGFPVCILANPQFEVPGSARSAVCEIPRIRL